MPYPPPPRPPWRCDPRLSLLRVPTAGSTAHRAVVSHTHTGDGMNIAAAVQAPSVLCHEPCTWQHTQHVQGGTRGVRRTSVHRSSCAPWQHAAATKGALVSPYPHYHTRTSSRRRPPALEVRPGSSTPTTVWRARTCRIVSHVSSRSLHSAPRHCTSRAVPAHNALYHTTTHTSPRRKRTSVHLAHGLVEGVVVRHGHLARRIEPLAIAHGGSLPVPPGSSCPNAL